MATDHDFVEYVHEQSGLGPALMHKKMFGEYGLYFDGRMALVAADNRLFLKPTEAGRALLPHVVEAPIFPGSKNWFAIDEWLDDNELLQKLIRVTAAELPLPKPKPVKKTSTKPAKPTLRKAVKKTPSGKAPS